jgi:hypothetical protein
MVSLEVNDAVVLEQQKVLEAALSTNPKTEKALQKLIRKALMQARASMEEYVKSKLDNNDPRSAARAIRTSVYRKILGGNMNILNGKKTHGTNNYEPPRTLRPGQRGGNRRPRSARTNTVMHYSGEDRGFILRFVNSGTKQRAIERMMEFKKAGGGSKFKWVSDASQYGNRGSISARGFFRSGAEPRLQRAVEYLADLIDEELENMLNYTK